MTLSRRTLLAGLTVATAAGLTASAAQSQSQIKNLRAAVQKAIEGSGLLELPAGKISASGIEIPRALTISGVAGRTLLVSPNGEPIFIISGPEPVVLDGLTFDGGGNTPDGAALLRVNDAATLIVSNCTFRNGASGIRLEASSGRIADSTFSDLAGAAIFARDSKGLEIASNTITGIGNNGIQVWTSEPREDGTIIRDNRVSHVAAKAGGTGQNGNGINVYRAGNVIVSGNRISDCAFSAIRNNAGSNCQITGNSISRTGEVAIYCEFGFEGAVVSDNLIEDVALGISITNFNEGGRLAVVSNNVIRKVKGGGSLPDTNGVGIGAEADTLVTGNVIEEARDTGISLGWGPYARNLSATGNLIRNCRRGIMFSVTEGADAVLVSNNRISGSTDASILGSDHGVPRTEDLGLAGADAGKNLISGNLVQ